MIAASIIMCALAAFAGVVGTSAAAAPTILWSNDLLSKPLFGSRIGAQCASTIVNDSDSRLYLLGGVTRESGYTHDCFVGHDGGLSWTRSTAAFLGLDAAQSVRLGNGQLLYMGGTNVSSAEGESNKVYASQDEGRTWTLSTPTAAWSARAWHASAAVPYTNIVVIAAGGSIDAVASTDNVYISMDGSGSLWMATTTAAPFGDQLTWPSMVAMYDETASSNATLIISGGGNEDGIMQNMVYVSTDLGATWPFIRAAEWDLRWLHTTLADLDNNVYVVGGQLDRGHEGRFDNEVWMSTDKAQSWVQLDFTNSVPAITEPCVAMRYVVTEKVVVKQIIIYSGMGNGVIHGNLSVMDTLTATVA